MLRPLTPPIFLLLPLLWLFRRALFLGEAFAFRDSSYYYFPLYQYVHERWAQGIPLWNPLDGIGQPLLGDPTAAALYPAKLVFSLPLPYAHCFAIYVVGHLWLAGYGAYRFGRHLKFNWHGAILAGVSYELSGQVLFQYCNPIYLVGAAWLPFALMYFHATTKHQPKLPSIIGLSITLSMMILGGAPQMAMHCVLSAFVWCGIMLARLQARSSLRTLMILGGSCLLAIALAAVQVLPSQEWASRSERATTETPRSLFEVGKQYAKTGTTSVDGLWNREALNSNHDSKIYDFSVGPWRWSELFWPNISGQFGPQNTRWIRGLPGEGRMWSASLYLGLLPICLALSCCRFQKGSQAIRWLTWLVVLSVIAALGEYGIGWIADELRFQSDGEFRQSPILRGFGGLYWFLTVTVPGYVEFRYPAKWWTVTSLGVSLLAARGWPLLRSKRRYRAFMRFSTLSFAVLAATLVCRYCLARDIPASSAFGPFDSQLAFRQFTVTLLHVLAVSGAIAWLLNSKQKGVSNWAVLCVCVIEITAAQGWMIHTAPNLTRPTPAAKETVWRKLGHDFPPAFRTESSPNRIQEAREHDLRSLMPKFHLTTKQRQLNSISSMQCGDYEAIVQAMGGSPYDTEPTPDLLKLLGAVGNQQKAWLVYDWQQKSTRDKPLDEWTSEVTRDAEGNLRDFQQLAIVETDDDLPVARNATSFSNTCEIVADRPERMELHVTTSVPALLVMRDQFYPDWFASITSATVKAKPAKVYRVNRVMRGVFVPAGESKIVLRYLPRSFYIGAAVSLASWLTTLTYMLRRSLKSA